MFVTELFSGKITFEKVSCKKERGKTVNSRGHCHTADIIRCECTGCIVYPVSLLYDGDARQM